MCLQPDHFGKNDLLLLFYLTFDVAASWVIAKEVLCNFVFMAYISILRRHFLTLLMVFIQYVNFNKRLFWTLPILFFFVFIVLCVIHGLGSRKELANETC